MKPVAEACTWKLIGKLCHASTAALVLFFSGVLIMTTGASPLYAGDFVPAWVKDAVFYQIFPERFANGDTTNDPDGVERWGGRPTSRNFFGGDLQGIIDHLDYIQDLGANAIYLNPIFEATTNHKYNTTDHMRIDPHFGDDAVFKRLLDSCHARGIRVVIDGVFNHTGVDFFAFADVKAKGELSPYKEWYTFHSFPVSSPSHPNYECWWGHGTLPKLRTEDPAVREYLFAVTRKWMSMGIDGWRLDVPNEIPHEFWIEWRKLVKSINPECYIVGELWENAAAWLKGDQFDAVMNYRFRDHALKFFAQGKFSPSAFDTALAHQRDDYPESVDFALQNLLGSHDTERLLTVCDKSEDRVRLAVLFQMTYPGAPMIYYGDEIGMEGGKDPACRGTMVWEVPKQRVELRNWFKAMIALRRANPVWRHGAFTTLRTDDAKGVYIFSRHDANGCGVVAINASAGVARVAVPLFATGSTDRWKIIHPYFASIVPDKDGNATLVLPPMSAAIFLREM
jgi:cyclomaltodextrinase / maltogenic alpha-amylase / neopullulanase